MLIIIYTRLTAKLLKKSWINKKFYIFFKIAHKTFFCASQRRWYLLVKNTVQMVVLAVKICHFVCCCWNFLTDWQKECKTSDFSKFCKMFAVVCKRNTCALLDKWQKKERKIVSSEDWVTPCGALSVTSIFLTKEHIFFSRRRRRLSQTMFLI